MNDVVEEVKFMLNHEGPGKLSIKERERTFQQSRKSL